jgi:hypothetical protein
MTTADQAFTGDLSAVHVLLRDELAAVEVYTRLAVELADEAVVAGLQKIRDGHRRAVRELRDCAVELVAVLPEQVGVTAPGIPAPTPSLVVLRDAEQARIRTYEAAVTDDAIPPNCHALIHTHLLPASRRHVEALTRLMEEEHAASGSPGT